MKTINVGLIGYGLSGRVFHGTVIGTLEGFEIKKVVTTNPEKINQAHLDFPLATIHEKASDVISAEDIDLIVICTVNTSHALIAIEAMRSGKHVLVEKPFTVSSEEADELIEVSKQTQRILSVYHNRRYDSDFRTVQMVLQSGKLGRVVEFESHFDRFRKTLKNNSWREESLPGSGTLYDLGPHLIDQALSLFGLPIEVYADIQNQRGGKVDDCFEISLYYPQNKVILKAGNLVKEPSPRFIIHGTEGSYVKYGMDVQETKLREEGLKPPKMYFAEDLTASLEKDKSNSNSPGALWGEDKKIQGQNWGEEDQENWGILNTTESKEPIETCLGDYRMFYKQLYLAIVFGVPLEVSAKDGYHTIKIIEMAILSNREKKRILFKE